MLRNLVRGAVSRGAAARESTTNINKKSSAGWRNCSSSGFNPKTRGASPPEMMDRAFCSSTATLCCAAAVGTGVLCTVSCASSLQPSTAQAALWRGGDDVTEEKSDHVEKSDGHHDSISRNCGVAEGTSTHESDGGPERDCAAVVADEEADLLKEQALDFIEAGDAERGQALLEQALAIYEVTHGVQSVQVAGILSELALVIALQGKYGSADVLLRRTLAIDVEAFGWDGGETTADVNNFGLMLQEQGRMKEAEAMFRRCVLTGERTLPQDSMHLAVWRSNLARVIGLGGSIARNRQLEALSLLNASLDALEGNLGPYHQDTLCVMERIASLHIKLSEWRPAEDILESVVDRYEQSVGKQHPRTITATKNLREVLACQGKSWSSRRHLVSAYRSLLEAEEEHGQVHPAVEPALTEVAQLLRQEGRYEEALTLYFRAVQCVDGPGSRAYHPRVACALNNYALALMQVGRASEAEPHLWRTVRIAEVAYGKEHHVYFRGLSNLAGALERRGNVAQAEEVMRQCVILASKALGYRHPDVVEYVTQLDKVKGFVCFRDIVFEQVVAHLKEE